MINVSLPIIRISTDTDGKPVKTEEDHSLWLVVNQECELANQDSASTEATIELRPVYSSENLASPNWGIRSRILRLSPSAHLISDSPRLHVSSSFLSVNVSRRMSTLTDERAIALKTWLGLRYDRPAVPPECVTLAIAIAEALRRPRHPITAEVHDVLIQFSDDAPPYYELFAVSTEEADKDAVREWVAGAVLTISQDLGVMRSLDVGTRAETSLELIESSYSADLSQITWRGPRPTGANIGR
jgi:hypothetical protein